MTEPTTHLSDALPGELNDGTAAGHEPSASVNQYLVFRLAGERYAIDIHDIVEILKYRPATPVPQASALIHGIVSVRGRIITVVDARHRLGLDAAPMGGETRIIVLRDGEESVGLLVDEVLQVEKLSSGAMSAPPSTLVDAAGRGIAAVSAAGGDSILIILDRKAFLKF